MPNLRLHSETENDLCLLVVLCSRRDRTALIYNGTLDEMKCWHWHCRCSIDGGAWRGADRHPDRVGYAEEVA